MELKQLVAETIINSSRIIDLNATMLSLNESMKLAAAETKLEALATNKTGIVSGIDAGINSLRSWSNVMGMQLQNDAGGLANFSTAGGKFSSDWAVTQDLVAGVHSYQDFFDRIYEAGGAIDQSYGQAAKLDSINKDLEAQRDVVRSLGGVPKFAAGTNLIPQDMLALLHKGEAVVPAAYNPAANPDYSRYGAAGTEALCAEIKALRDEVTQLRAESRAGDQAIASATAKTAKILERVTPDGTSLQTVAAT